MYQCVIDQDDFLCKVLPSEAGYGSSGLICECHEDCKADFHALTKQSQQERFLREYFRYPGLLPALCRR